MDRWEKPLRDDRYRHQRQNPSFSSTLLDVIYRSIDESGNGKGEEEQLIFYRETMRKKHEINHGFKGEEMTSLQRACMIEKWMEKKVSHEKVSVRRKSMADFDKKSRKDLDSVLLNSSSSSSESSCGGVFSSSESESIYGVNSSRSSTTSYTMQRPKPVRTSISARPEKYQRREDLHQTDTFQHYERNYAPNQKAKPEGSFVKTKSKALKIYSDLKKVKQPISPGRRLASFLNSLFTTGNAKKAKITTPGGSYEERKLKSDQASTCSSASSFSRSCLSKTPSSRGGKLSSNNGAKRSVRFYPVSVIVDEDCRPCGHKNLYGSDRQEMSSTLVAAAVTTATRNNVPTSDEELKLHVMNENRRIEEVARDLLKNYQKKKEEQFDHMSTDLCNDNTHQVCSEEEEEESDDDDDIASCASSDLFELDNLSVVGIERYREELPVYETTHLGTNRAIANGLFL
ncbi:protein BIG GRAIN 1-like B [Populus nigra]|uniref:protein BIG GRAIN 1-like B n=1 Tax=Populus nigra TaxID=3691 RepID=UPI002B277665|nr:protein BIG GRAIN 1-like B [Populus nigra]